MWGCAPIYGNQVMKRCVSTLCERPGDHFMVGGGGGGGGVCVFMVCQTSLLTSTTGHPNS